MIGLDMGFSEKYQAMMLNPDPTERVKANLFIEMQPVLDLYEDLGKRAGRTKRADSPGGLTELRQNRPRWSWPSVRG